MRQSEKKKYIVLLFIFELAFLPMKGYFYTFKNALKVSTFFHRGQHLIREVQPSAATLELRNVYP